MQNLTEIKENLKSLKAKLADDFAVERIGVFGSFSRNEQNDDSDIDILVEFSRPVGYEFFRLQRFLEKQLGRKIDLATKAMLKPRIKDSVLKETTFV
jgi:predicted nucleotidyltransferase